MTNNYDERVKQRHSSQINNEENNPCFKEHNLSLKCLNENNFDPELCQLHFENYRNCNEFWNAVKRERRIKGVKPYLPPLSERNELKAKYFATGKLS